jgi:hypothetical protein
VSGQFGGYFNGFAKALPTIGLEDAIARFIAELVLASGLGHLHMG